MVLMVDTTIVNFLGIPGNEVGSAVGTKNGSYLGIVFRISSIVTPIAFGLWLMLKRW